MSKNAIKYIDLNIGANLLEHLTVSDAIKELIANALDEHTMNNIDNTISIVADKKIYKIIDYGKGITRKNFQFNINKVKQQSCDMIGFFGYGLKDAIAILFQNKIGITIITKKHIFTPMFCPKDNTGEMSLQMEMRKNTTIELENNYGTEIRLEGLKKKDIIMAEKKFLILNQPNILYEVENEISMFKQTTSQSIYMNGIELCENTGYHYSYDIKATPELKQQLNRDRKNIDLKIFKNRINILLSKIVLNDLITEDIINILKTDNVAYIQEFSNIKTLRNIITQLNNTDKYIFVGTHEIWDKYSKEIEESNRTVLYLGNYVKTKFNTKSIKNLSNPSVFDKKNLDIVKEIFTLSEFIEPIGIIIDIITLFENKFFTIDDDIKNNLKNISIEETDDMTDDLNLLISDKLLNNKNKLIGKILGYIISKLDEEQIEKYNEICAITLLEAKPKPKKFFGVW